MTKVLFLTGICVLLLSSSAFPTDIPKLINYQGMLTDDSGGPLTGSYNMTFRIYNAPSGGSLRWQETHTGVSVTNGLFNVILGSVNPDGVNLDFSEEYWLDITAGGEHMSGRLRFTSVGYAYRAHRADTASVAVAAPSGGGWTDDGSVVRLGTSSDQVGIGLSNPNRKLYVAENVSGLSFPAKLDNPHSTYNTDATGILFSVGGDGGHQLSTDRGKGGLVYQLTGTWNRGSFHFLQSDSANNSTPSLGQAVMTIKNNGNVGIGTTNPNSLLELKGSDATLSLNSTSALSQLRFVQNDANKWTMAYNSGSGYMYFYDHTAKAGTRMVLQDGTGNVGIGAAPPEHKLDVRGDRIRLKEDATGDWIAMRTDGDVLDFSFAGGNLYVQSINAGEHVLLNPSTNSRVGVGTPSPLTKLHVDASGCEARLGYEGYSGSSLGIWAEGAYAGGSFRDTESGNFCHAGYSSYKTYGVGSNDFVQNHPYSKDQVITYAGLEGDEVATYTRGHARLTNGQALVKLGETLKWVTNPDIGLTAHITPRGECEGLYVASLTTSEMLVKEMRGGNSNIEFDYLVCGLRIGFEEASVVQEKKEEAYIPSMNDHRDLYNKYPELRLYNAVERFRRMNAEIGRPVPDLSASEALRDAIHEFDPAIDRLPEPD
ncbi:MAG: hypothetical protein JSV10_09395 [Candidatus Zixiibacteriota bacterium]|nr:MAG: hypothetical protein JSV10_09395 [candidate division Zixibacteria bacterium]